MVIIACQCGEGLGLAHEHVEERQVYRRLHDGLEISLPGMEIALNSATLDTLYTWVRSEPGFIRIWVDWKEVARAIALSVVSPVMEETT